MRNFGYIEQGKGPSFAEFGLWRRIFSISRGYQRAIGVAVLLSLVLTGTTLSLPYLIKNAIDLYITATALTTDARIEGVSSTALLFAGLVIVIFVITFFQVLLLEWVGQSVMHRIRQNLFSHLLDLDLGFLEKQPTGRLVTRLTNDIQNMHEMFTSVMVTIFNDVLRIVGILLVLFLTNFRLALVMSLFVPVSALITVFFARLARKRFRAIRSQLSKLNTYIQESVSGISIIQLFNRQTASAERFRELSGEYLNRTLSQIRLFAFFMPLTEFLSMTAIALILWYGGALILEQSLTIGELVAFLAYMRLFFQPLRELSQKYSIVQSALASAERIFEMLDVKPGITDPEQPASTQGLKGAIKFQQIGFSYDQDSPILRGIDLSIQPGETVAIVGATGSGKTTLINLLLRFYEPDQGRITIDDRDIRTFTLRDLRRYIGVILQDVFILPQSMLDNIRLDKQISRAQVETIIEETGMKRIVDNLPDGLDTMIGEGGMELSAGEKQILSFARTLCQRPGVLVLDEATASVDSVTESVLEKALTESFSDITSLVIAHRLSTIRRANRIIVMKHGIIVEQGSHEQLMDNNLHYANMIRLDLLKASPQPAIDS